MNPAVTCTDCGRKFQAEAAFPVIVQTMRNVAGRVTSKQSTEPGCPECFAFDERTNEAIRVPGGHYGPQSKNKRPTP